MERESGKPGIIKSFRLGAVCLAFLLIGYETSIFIHRASVERSSALREHPDTVFVIDSSVAAALLESGSGKSSGVRGDCHGAVREDTPFEGTAGGGFSRGEGTSVRTVSSGGVIVTKRASGRVVDRAGQFPVRESRQRRVESFRFNPNTVSVEDLRRLGFSEKQAAAIDNYRAKGGRFRRRGDFAKSFVVADSVYRRLEKYIDIPLIDINTADSAAFDTLPGIGGFFAAKMVSYRRELGGYSYKEQLMDIWHFDREKYDGLSDLITCSPPRDSFALWSLPADSLCRHPYVRKWSTARAIVFYREHNPLEKWTVDGLAAAGILDGESAEKLSRCALK